MKSPPQEVAEGEGSELLSPKYSPGTVQISLPRLEAALPALPEGHAYRLPHQILSERWALNGGEEHFAWIRPVLCAGLPLANFARAFQTISASTVFLGRQIAVLPVQLDHGAEETNDLVHMVCAETGNREVEVHPGSSRFRGGAHLMLCVEANEGERNRDDAPGLEILEALEGAVRLHLGEDAAIAARFTRCVSLENGESQVSSGPIRVFGADEGTAFDVASQERLLKFLEASHNSPPATQLRVRLGLRWLNTGVHNGDLLALWTALEILAAGRGRHVSNALSRAYGHPASQRLADELGLTHIYAVRNKHAHEGISYSLSPLGISYLKRVAADLANIAVGVDCQKLATQYLRSHGVLPESEVRLVRPVADSHWKGTRD